MELSKSSNFTFITISLTVMNRICLIWLKNKHYINFRICILTHRWQYMQVLLTQAMATLGTLARAEGEQHFSREFVEKCINTGLELVRSVDNPDVRKCAYNLPRPGCVYWCFSFFICLLVGSFCSNWEDCWAWGWRRCLWGASGPCFRRCGSESEVDHHGHHLQSSSWCGQHSPWPGCEVPPV